jgi:hypothetical protein
LIGCAGDSETAPSARREPVALNVASEHATAHSAPSQDSEIVGQVMVATNVWGDSMAGEWWRIEHEGRRVWLHKSLVDTGHLLEPLVVHRQARALEGVLQERADRQMGEIEKLRDKTLSGE